MTELPVSTLRQIIFGDDVDKGDVDDDAPNPFEQLKHESAVRAALGKSDQRPAVILDLRVAEGDVDDDNAPLYKSPMVLPGGLPKTTGAAFVKLLAEIRRVFGRDEEAMAGAVEIVTRVRDEERAAMLAQIAAAR
jgi:hypothetical protein